MASIASKVIPLFERVLVQKIAQESKTASGILIAESKSNLQAKVIAVSEGGKTKAGDIVLLPEVGGTKVMLDNSEYHFFKESDILAKLPQ